MFEFYGIAFIAVCPGLDDNDKKIGRDIALAVTGILLAVYSAGLENDDVAHIVDVVALIISGYGLLSSAIDMRNVRNQRSPNSSPFMVLGIATAISGVGCLKSVTDVKGDYFG